MLLINAKVTKVTKVNFQNGRHFELDKSFLPEVEYTRRIAMSISDILSFWSTL